MRHKRQSATICVLKAFMPYSRQNLALAFKPNYFFNELEKNSNFRKQTIKRAWETAISNDFITEVDGKFRMTAIGLRYTRPFTAKKLDKDVRLMVVFDIPESRASDRRKLRWLLKKWEFDMIQKSVWTSRYDHKNLIQETVKEMGLTEFVQLYESARLLP
jgi:CRISPR-associated endonuclease Cas2